MLAAFIRADAASFVAFEAEAGTLGADWAVSNTVSPTALTNITIISTGAGNNPGSAARVASYTVTFPAAGTYHLYTRIRTGAGTFNDDSLFLANGFGTKSPTLNSDWILANGLAGVGFSNSAAVVTGGGTLGSGMWKWINLSLFSGAGEFTVPAGNLTQTFQIGAREDGLDFDKFVFGRTDYTFTVSDLDTGGLGTPPPAPIAIVDPTKMHQTIEGFGGAICFYNGWVTAHPYKDEIMTNAFAGLNLSMLRLGNWFRYQGTTNFDPDAPGFVAKANQVLGRPVQVFMSSWAPPAFLKSNGQVGNGGTLVFTNGGFAYNEFAQYWYDSLVAYRNIGVSPNWISIQNEPDWEASYDSCIFRPTEGMYNGTNWAGYSNALSATYLKVASLPSPPRFLGPEPVGIGYSVPQNYAATMNANHFYGFNYHLYHGSTDGSANGYINSLRATTNLFPAKPRFMTEFGVSNMIESATLIHNCLTEGQVSGYNHWSLIWPTTDGGLIQIEFPWNQAQWTNAPPGTPTQSKGYWLAPAYWAMKHFSYYVTPGSRRITATNNDPNIKTSAYLTADNLRLVVVLINRRLEAATVDLNFVAFPYASSGVYQTAGANKFQSLGAVGSQLTLPPESLTTVVLDKFVAVGPASDPSPANSAASVALNTGFNWTAGSNAVLHAVYLGASSNAVFTATSASAEFKGYVTNNSLAAAALFGSATYYWRVDEIAGANTNAGAVWSFSTAPAPALLHRYSFSETGGTTVVDSDGGPAWNGPVFNGGALAGGQLTLASASSQYVNLPAGLVSTLSNFTITAWVRLNSASGWARIFDFGSNTTRYMFLTPTNGGASGRLRFGITTNSSGGEQQITGPTALSVGVWHHVAVTLNGNTGVLYLNGMPQATNASMTLRPATLGSTGNNYLGRSQWSDPYLNGQLDEFRIYSVAHSAAEIAAMAALGPNELLSSASPPLSLTPTPTTLTLTWPLASAGFTVQSRTNLVLGDWVNVASPTPQIIGGQWQVTVPVSASASALFYRLVK